MNFPLEVIDLHKTYRVSKERDPSGCFKAVRGISFQVQKGECFGLLGPNGAGKSTTIQCISGFYPASSGQVRILRHDVYREPKKARKVLGMCAQEETLDSDFKVIDQMVRHASYYRIPAADGLKRSKELLKRFGLQDRANDEIESLSGGMRRRLQVARALVSNPEVLVLDEPTTGLDPEVRRVLWDVIMECREKGMAILLSTHYMEEAQRLCDRVSVSTSGHSGIAVLVGRTGLYFPTGDAQAPDQMRTFMKVNKAKRFLGVGLGAAALLIFSGASGASTSNPFPFHLYQTLASTQAPAKTAEAGNLIFSPYSVSQAFKLADLGARGPTRIEIEREIDVNAEIAPPSTGENAPALEIANKIWLEKTAHIEASYLQAMQKEAGAVPGYADFIGDPAGARGMINSWVADQTHEKIQNLIPPGALSTRTRLILANAIYFKGAWQTPFKKQMTIDEDFHLTGGATTKAPFMREHNRFDFTQDKTAQVIELPYLGREFAMIIAFPKKGVSLAKLGRALSPELLDHWKNAMRFVDVELSLPRFKFSSDFVLNHALKTLGVRLPFESGRADFSGIDGAKDLYISNVFHKAFISVDEAGTEAAAATAIELRMKAIMQAPKPVVMNVDHPFVFAIQDLRSKAILFLGRVTNPKE